MIRAFTWRRIGALTISLASTGALASGSGAPKIDTSAARMLLDAPTETQGDAATVDVEYEYQTLSELAASRGRVSEFKDSLAAFVLSSPLASLPMPTDPLQAAFLSQFTRTNSQGEAPKSFDSAWFPFIDLPGLVATADGITLDGRPVDPNFTRALLELPVDLFEAGGALQPGSCHRLRRTLLLATLLRARIDGESASAWQMDCALFARWAAMIKTLEIAYESSYGNASFMSCGEPYFLAHETIRTLAGLDTHLGVRLTQASYDESIDVYLGGAPATYQTQIRFRRQFHPRYGFPIARIERACAQDSQPSKQRSKQRSSR